MPYSHLADYPADIRERAAREVCDLLLGTQGHAEAALAGAL